MRPFFLLIFCVCLAIRSFAQTFISEPDPLFQKEIQFDQANECYIYFKNLQGDSLQLHWRLIELNLPQGWDADICDYGHCYIGTPSNGLMNTAYDTVRPYLKLIVQPGQVPGTSWIWFRVYLEGNPDNFVDVFYSLHTPGTLSDSEPGVFDLQAYPNPASDYLILENKGESSMAARVSNANGQWMWQGTIPSTCREQIGVGEWPAGLYFIQSRGRTERIMIRK